MVLQRVLHGERLDELLRADETQSVLEEKRENYQGGRDIIGKEGDEQ